MATTITLYNHVPWCFSTGTIVWPTDDIKLALIGSGYVFDSAHTVLADASDYEISGDGYTPGGMSLTGKTATDSDGVVSLDADNLEWSALTATFRFGLLYKSGTINGKTDPLIACILFNDTPADIAVEGTGYPVTWSNAGIILGTIVAG
ncbi:MAG: hypothetical protein AB7D37_06130 [Desulfovibrio sp.]